MTLAIISIIAYVLCCSFFGRDMASLIFLAGLGIYFLKKTGRTRENFLTSKVRFIFVVVCAVSVFYMFMASIVYRGWAFNFKNILGMLVVAFDAGVAYHVARTGIVEFPCKLAAVFLLLMLGWLWALLVAFGFCVGFIASGRPINLNPGRVKSFEGFKWFKLGRKTRKPAETKERDTFHPDIITPSEKYYEDDYDFDLDFDDVDDGEDYVLVDSEETPFSFTPVRPARAEKTVARVNAFPDGLPDLDD